MVAGDEDYLNRPEDEYYIEEVDPERQEGWTTRSDIATDEAEPYLAPVDPPVLPSTDQGIEVATGFGTTSEDAPVRPDAPPGDASIVEEVRRVLREDSATSHLRLDVRIADGVIYLHGPVSDAADSELAEGVASRVPGVVGVEDCTQVQPT